MNRTDKLMAPIVEIALLALPIYWCLQQAAGLVADPDNWWHLRAGQWIVEHRTVPATDPFSAYGADKPWIAYSWLYEITLYGLYAAFGLPGFVVYSVIFMVAITEA